MSIRATQQNGKLFDYVLPVLLVLGLVTPIEDLWGRIFEILLLPLFIWSLWRHGLGGPRAIAACSLPLIWIVWLGASGGWGTESAYEEWDHTSLKAFMTALFFVICTTYVRATPVPRLTAVGKFLVLGALTNMTAGLSLHIWRGEVGVERLSGVGIFEHEIMASYVATLFAACALHLFWTAEQRCTRILMLIYLVLAFVYIAFTGSRSGMAVYLFALASYVAVASDAARAARIALVGGAALLAVLLGLYAFFPSLSDFFIETLQRRSYRIAIWLEAWELSWNRPILGHGIGDDTRFVGWIYHPHNLHLSNFFYSGAVGLLLGVATYFATFLMALRPAARPCRALAVSVFAYLFASVLLETELPIEKPNVIWYQFWVPLCLIWGFGLKEDAFADAAIQNPSLR